VFSEGLGHSADEAGKHRRRPIRLEIVKHPKKMGWTSLWRDKMLEMESTPDRVADQRADIKTHGFKFEMNEI
jgi:hypothetical protein